MKESRAIWTFSPRPSEPVCCVYLNVRPTPRLADSRWLQALYSPNFQGDAALIRHELAVSDVETGRP